LLIAADLPQNATIIISTGESATFFEKLVATISRISRVDLVVLDLCYCGSNGFVSGRQDAVQQSASLLQDLGLKWYYFAGALGSARKMMAVNQLLVGLHTATAAEAMGLAAKAGLNTRQVYNVITNAAGNSRAFESRVKNMLEGNWTGTDTLASACEKLVWPCYKHITRSC
jgi:hypothetical protein